MKRFIIWYNRKIAGYNLIMLSLLLGGAALCLKFYYIAGFAGGYSLIILWMITRALTPEEKWMLRNPKEITGVALWGIIIIIMGSLIPVMSVIECIKWVRKKISLYVKKKEMSINLSVELN